MLDLHLMQKNVAVLGDFDIARSTNKHLHGALRAKVSRQHILQASRCCDIQLKCKRRTCNFGLGVQRLNGRHTSQVGLNNVAEWRCRFCSTENRTENSENKEKATQNNKETMVRIRQPSVPSSLSPMV
eukprot:m.64006 g.64006  ORF g.64006 m.64006 type:complete len:128 (-) comp13473_c0_seq1:109-492(-)